MKTTTFGRFQIYPPVPLEELRLGPVSVTTYGGPGDPWLRLVDTWSLVAELPGGDVDLLLKREITMRAQAQEVTCTLEFVSPEPMHGAERAKK